MNVTPEMLLFLAGKMGLPNPVAEQGECCYVEAPGVWRVFNPATDDAQFGRLVVWAAMQGMEPDSTPDSIRAAAVVAVCRALGWEGEE